LSSFVALPRGQHNSCNPLDYLDHDIFDSTAFIRGFSEATPVIDTRPAARHIRQQGPDGGPFIIGEFTPHDSILHFGSLNHDLQTDGGWDSWAQSGSMAN
jgi:hypothetical protein